jgi:membrane associated rhomboid family serine protease/Zn-finger nucleic acid-binding protein
MNRCPVCESALKVETLPTLAVYRCPHGHGTAMTVPLFRRLAGAKLATAAWAAAWGSASESGRLCPQCSQVMSTGAVPWDGLAFAGSEGTPLALDFCQKCSVVWLDAEDAARLPGLQQKAAELRLGAEKAARAVQAKAEMSPYLREERKNEFRGDAPAEPWKVIPAMIGLPVEYDSPTIGAAWATWALIALTVFTSVQGFGDEQIIKDWGFIPQTAWSHGGLTAFTTFFLHAGWLHLLGNLYALWIFGDDVEIRLGRLRYLALIVVSTIAGAWLHGISDSRSTVPLVGASGGIAGVIAAYALLFPHARLGIVPFFIAFRIRWVSFPAWVALIGWGLLQLFVAARQAAGETDVSGMAHLGGAVVGFAVGYWAKRRLAPPPGVVHD